MMLYLGSSDLPIYHFNQIQETGNLAYLVMEWNGRGTIKIPEEASKLWDLILEVWHEKTANNESSLYYQLYNEVDYLEKRLMILEVLINGINEKNKEEYGSEIIAWGYQLNLNAKIKPQFKGLKRQIRASKSSLSIKNNQLELMTNKKGMSLLKQKIKLERALGIKIDLKTTPIDEWLELFNEATELTEKHNRVNSETY